MISLWPIKQKTFDEKKNYYYYFLLHNNLFIYLLFFREIKVSYQIGTHSARPFFQSRQWRAGSNLDGGVHLAFANHLI